MNSPEKYDAIIEACDSGISPIVKSIVYRRSVELYYLFLKNETTTGDWKSQAVRSASSVGANLCEGFGRGAGGNRINFYKIARGSAYETVHWANLAENDRNNLLEKALEVSALMDMELQMSAREAQEIL